MPIPRTSCLAARGAMGRISAWPCLQVDGAIGCVSGGGGSRSQFRRALRRKLAGNPQKQAQNEACGSVFQLSWRACAQQLAQDQAQVEPADMNQLPLQDILPSAQVAPPHAAGLVAVGEAALHQFAAPSE